MHPDNDPGRTQIEKELAIETLARSGSLTFRATGSSMLPEIWPGDVLLVRQRRIEDIEIGDIAFFRCYGSLVAHRVIARGAVSVLIACGDTVQQPDPLVTAENLLGFVEFVERGGRRFAPRRGPGLVSRTIARLARGSRSMNRAIQRLRAIQQRAFA